MIRNTLPFNDSWRFQREIDCNVPFYASESDFDDSDWRSVDLPHDWGVETDFNHANPGGNRYGFLESGLGWYRKSFEVDAEMLEKRVVVRFGCIYRHSDVYINGHHLGHRANGWVEIRYDLTPYLHEGENVLVVRVNNSRQPCSRWYTGSGILREVDLLFSHPVHLVEDGICVTQTHESGKVSLSVSAEWAGASEASVSNRLLDAKGSCVAEGTDVLTVVDPELWSPESPTLYTLETKLTVDGDLVDQMRTTVGLREFTISATRGFEINGVTTKLKGFCIKEDHGPIGTAIPHKLWRRKLEDLRDMGCNAIRCGHYPFARIFYEVCDELGFVVMDEMCDGWDKPKGQEDYGQDWAGNWQRDFRDTIRLHRNHACIAF